MFKHLHTHIESNIIVFNINAQFYILLEYLLYYFPVQIIQISYLFFAFIFIIFLSK